MDCDVEVMPISLATWVLIVTFHYGQWQRGDPQPHLEDVTQGPMRRRQSQSDLEMSEHCAWDDTQILHELGRSSTSKTPCSLRDMLVVKNQEVNRDQRYSIGIRFLFNWAKTYRSRPNNIRGVREKEQERLRKTARRREGGGDGVGEWERGK